VEEFINTWSEAVLGKGLTFDFFSDPLVLSPLLSDSPFLSSKSFFIFPIFDSHNGKSRHTFGHVFGGRNTVNKYIFLFIKSRNREIKTKLMNESSVG
jgi:hypothetical protein